MPPKDLVGEGTPYSTASSVAEQVQRELGDRYLVRHELGRGGTAYVYLAEDLQRGCPVAIKVLRPELVDAMGGMRFLREIEIIRQLKHPNILPLYDAGECGGTPYFTMPYVEGATLRDRLRREQQLPLSDMVAISRQVASALDHAHGRGLIHRDIKPANILLSADGVKVADFGIARAIYIASGETITSSAIAIGTPEYMSPEQASGGSNLDARCDIYALGCVMYEMLAGSPPFTGPTAEAIIARQRHDVPHSVRVVRPSVPPALESLVMTALAKVRVDRFATATELIDALDAIDLADTRPVKASRSARWRATVAAVAVSAMIGVGWWLLDRPAAPLDPRRIVVFPPVDQAAPASDGTSEAVATYIGYALEETRPLKWLEARELTDQRAGDLARLTPREANRLSTRGRAAYYIDGTILRRADSATVVLRLRSVEGDSTVRTAGASGAAEAYLPQLALRAVGNLLPFILQPGAAVDLRSLSERSTTAVANFLQGEREYRRMQFPAALEHYRAAVEEDSAFAIAAFKGAQTATWMSPSGIDTTFIQVALRRTQHLTGPQTLLAKGLYAYVRGNPDSAVTYLRAALRTDSTLAGAWPLLGEVYARSLVSEPAADSMARAALRKAREMDRGFAPTLVLLEEMALRDGDMAVARQLRAELGRAGADTTHATERTLMWRCLERGPQAVDWKEAARREPSAALDAGRVLARGASQPVCARAALLAAFESDSASPIPRRAALLALNGLLLTTGRGAELRELLASPRARGLLLWRFHLENAAIEQGFAAEANAARDSVGTDYATMDGPTLWALGLWAGQRNVIKELAGIGRAARHRADSSRAREDRLIAAGLDARLTLATGDTSRAIEQLQALKPTGPRRNIAWRPFEGLGAERLLLARLLFARGEYRRSIAVASLLDATEPVPYLLYLRPSVELRLHAANALGDRVTADVYKRRLERLAQ